jgi:bifunctional UDP-N-acetylglucosamine pyrophosphorylase/glucosamine-1-phosphate N-acetyltransferase
VYCFRRSILGPALRRLVPDNSQGELYLTDVIAVLREAGYPIATVVATDARETAGVNDRAQLASAEAALRARTNRRWLDAGVAMVDPLTTYIDATVTLAPDVTIFPNTMLQGATVVAHGAEIGPDTHLVDCMVGSGAVVRQTWGEDAEIGVGAVVGPFASLGPGASVADGERTGPFYAAPAQRSSP